jgi:hypothetical protein
MSLRKVPGGILHSLIEAVGLVLIVGAWAVSGFPHVWQVAALGCLIIICIGIHKWMASQP